MGGLFRLDQDLWQRDVLEVTYAPRHRSGISTSCLRSHGTTVCHLLGQTDFHHRWTDRVFAAMRYSPKWRAYRKTFHQHFNQNEVHTFQPIKLRECRAFFGHTIGFSQTESLGQHIQQIDTAIIIKIGYDMSTQVAPRPWAIPTPAVVSCSDTGNDVHEEL
ncbi:hypothetical protein QCA50_018519 [Cerrena zonata]|uniref:Uncharacterized protein n=1 Tax=Cerrena zonata TaxID=2478898 RepID=A0AAW0FJW4_9APHY